MTGGVTPSPGPPFSPGMIFEVCCFLLLIGEQVSGRLTVGGRAEDVDSGLVSRQGGREECD